MLKYGLFGACLVAATPALAQPANPGMPPAMQAAAQAFGQCVGAGINGLAATVTPEAGATTILAGCAAQRTALESAVETMISGMPITDAQKTEAREQMRAELAKAPTEVANAIRQRRAAPPAAAN